MTKKGVIGKDDKLPWYIPAEIDHFRKIVNGRTLIMGRSTFEVMKGHLVSSHNVVVTHSPVDSSQADFASSLEEALRKAHNYDPDVYLVGGQSIFEQSIPMADRMQLSYIKKDYEGNKFFPMFSEDGWLKESTEDFPEFEYVVYIKKR